MRQKAKRPPVPKIEAEPDYIGHTSAPYKLHAGVGHRAQRDTNCGVATGGRALALMPATRSMVDRALKPGP